MPVKDGPMIFMCMLKENIARKIMFLFLVEWDFPHKTKCMNKHCNKYKFVSGLLGMVQITLSVCASVYVCVSVSQTPLAHLYLRK